MTPPTPHAPKGAAAHTTPKEHTEDALGLVLAHAETARVTTHAGTKPGASERHTWSKLVEGGRVGVSYSGGYYYYNYYYDYYYYDYDYYYYYEYDDYYYYEYDDDYYYEYAYYYYYEYDDYYYYEYDYYYHYDYYDYYYYYYYYYYYDMSARDFLTSTAHVPHPAHTVRRTVGPPPLIRGEFLGIRQNGERGGYEFEGFVGAIGRAFVGMDLEGEFAVGFLDFGIRGLLGDAQDLMVVLGGEDALDEGALLGRAGVEVRFGAGGGRGRGGGGGRGGGAAPEGRASFRWWGWGGFGVPSAAEEVRALGAREHGLGLLGELDGLAHLTGAEGSGGTECEGGREGGSGREG